MSTGLRSVQLLPRRPRSRRSGLPEYSQGQRPTRLLRFFWDHRTAGRGSPADPKVSRRRFQAPSRMCQCIRGGAQRQDAHPSPSQLRSPCDGLSRLRSPSPAERTTRALARENSLLLHRVRPLPALMLPTMQILDNQTGRRLVWEGVGAGDFGDASNWSDRNNPMAHFTPTATSTSSAAVPVAMPTACCHPNCSRRATPSRRSARGGAPLIGPSD